MLNFWFISGQFCTLGGVLCFLGLFGFLSLYKLYQGEAFIDIIEDQPQIIDLLPYFFERK